MAASYLLPDEPCRSLEEYEATGRGDTIDRCASRSREELFDAIHQSGLRTRDHDAVTVSSKWQPLMAPIGAEGERYLVADATDSEPGSFVDRALIRRNPCAVIEGIAVAARILGVREAFVAIRRSFEVEYEILTKALVDAEMAGWLERLSIKCVRTPDAYLLSDQRALLECIDGREPLPIHPDPTTVGLFGTAGSANPTTVDTIETLANIAAVAADGPRWFRKLGTPVSPGNILCTVTGDVAYEDVVEIELGRRLIDAIEEAGQGFEPEGPPKAVLSGVSSPVLTRSRLAAPLSWEGLAAVGANLGRAAFVVYADDADMFEVAHRIAAYLYVESCGLCPACKFGGGEVTAYLARLVAGSGSRHDLEALGGRLATVTDGARCGIAQRLRDVVSSIMWAFPADAAAHLDGTTTEIPRPLEPIVDLIDGVAVYGDAQAHKRADWCTDEQPVRLTRW